MTEQEAQVLRDTATSAEQNALLNSQKLVKMQAEIDELRAALLESKDVGLRLLTCRSLFSLARGEINAQRKVLEQALTTINTNHHWHTEYDDFDGYGTKSQLHTQNIAAIAAIQGVLK